jgi:phospholipid/cholesterol/gamma-HCH transport system substrate-binding protein
MRLEIEHEAPVTKDTFATLSYQGVTGLAYVQLDDNGQPAPRLVPDDDNPPRIPLKPGLLSKLATRGEAILDEVETATKRVNQLLGDDNQRRVAGALDKLSTAAESAGQLAQRLDATVAKRVDPALAEATATMRSVKQSADEVGRTAADFDKTARRLNEKDGPIERLATGSEALSHAADSFNEATLPRINRVTEETSRAVRRLGRTASAIGDNPQSLIYGSGLIAPGPGEAGFTEPGVAK